MSTTTYTRRDLDREARYLLKAFKAKLPRAIRRTVRPESWKLRITLAGHVVLVSRFQDENGEHEITEIL